LQNYKKAKVKYDEIAFANEFRYELGQEITKKGWIQESDTLFVRNYIGAKHYIHIIYTNKKVIKVVI
jgi:hypothetical protein